MTLLSNVEIKILKTHLESLQKEKKTLRQILNTVAKQYESISTAYASLTDQVVEKELCIQYKIKNIQVFCPSVLKSLFDVDPERLKELYLKSYNSENKKYYIDFI
jgi:chromosome segregation ATPase